MTQIKFDPLSFQLVEKFHVWNSQGRDPDKAS